MTAISGQLLPPVSGKARSLVVFLHGYGANGADLLDIGRDWAEDLPDTAFISPDAPDVCEAFAGGFQWFSIRAAQITQELLDRAELVQRPAAALNAFLD